MAMKNRLILCLALAIAALAPVAAQAQGQSPAKEVRYYSEQVQVAGKLYLPTGFSPASKVAAVVLAPGWGKTGDSLDAYGKALAAKGLVALAIDYRGFGKSGGLIYLVQDVAMDDRLRFSNHTPKIRIRRGRLDPQAQIQDIRNAMTFLQGQAGVDRARIGYLGIDMAGGHAVALGGMDARIKAAVAVTPIIAGKDVPRMSYQPSAATQAEMIRLARTGAAPTGSAAGKAMNEAEAKVLLAEYRPFWWADAVPATASYLFLTAANDEVVKNADNADAASKLIKGSEIRTLAGAKHALTAAQTEEAAIGAATYLAAKL
ncbi:hypothetical protein BH11PSE2_BH11PSE2_13720 [soil metagenome]